MALPAAQQVRFWSIAAAIFLVALWFLGDVALPFMLGMVVAYILDPVVDWLEAHGVRRLFAVILLTILGFSIFAVGKVLVVPTLVRQLVGLVQTLPALAESVQSFLLTRVPALGEQDSALRQSLTEFATLLRQRGVDILERTLTSASGILSLATLIVIVPVVSFYLLLDWDRLTAQIDDLFPRDHAPVIRRIFGEINATLAGFIRGQGTVCLILGIYYSVALMTVGLDYGLVVGAIAGLLTFIPWIGALVGGALAIGLALFQFWGEWGWIAVVAAIFFSGQMIEGNFLTPKLVGDSVGLHPVWLLFALSVFGSIFGFAGMLVAVPLAAVIGVLVRFLVDEYKAGLLYQGVTGLGALAAHPPEDVSAPHETAETTAPTTAPATAQTTAPMGPGPENAAEAGTGAPEAERPAEGRPKAGEDAA